MQGSKIERGPRGRYARLICRGCRARKIKCVLPSPAGLGPLGTPQPEATCCERCRNLDLECIIERTYLGRPAAKRTKRTISSKSPKSELSNSPESSPLDEEKCFELSNSIRQYLFSGAMDDNLMLQRTRDNTGSAFGEDELYHSMSNASAFIASILAKDNSFGASIELIATWNHSLSTLVSVDLATTFDQLLIWHRLFILGIPSLISLRERLILNDPSSTNVATKLLFALLCLTACERLEDPQQKNVHLRGSLQQAVSSYGQEFIFCPPTHFDSVVLCRFLAAFKPTALATSQRVAHQAVKAELYINLAYRIAERLRLLPEPGSLPFVGANAIDSVEMECDLILSIQGVHLIADEYLLGDFLSMSLYSLRHVLQRMQPHIDSYEVLLQTRLCSPIMIFHIKWITAIYIQLEIFADAKQCWMNPNRLFVVVEEGERKCFAEINSSYGLLSEASGLGEQSELVAMCSLLELRFHGVIARILGLGLFYSSVLRARTETGQQQSNPVIRRDEATQLGDTVINSLMTTPEDQKQDSYFFQFLANFGERYPDKLQEILAKFLECTTMSLAGNMFHPPVRPIVLEIVNQCKNIIENNLVRFKVVGTLHPNFDKQLDLFTRCAKQLASMIAVPGSSPETAFSIGCVYSASSKMVYGLCDLMNSLKLQASLVKDWDETMGMSNQSLIPSENSMQFNSFETWNLWPYPDPLDRMPQLQNMFDWALPQSTATEFDPSVLFFNQ
ncbi:hypothetical protein N7456_012599 [Penicillium angulare]|uniref:Zn(2)-C6 fungal-type domain-containing protein n=1 Tax=Penicillium angulare TaxID=116970 RepID=A0A9W9EJW9_9EURO|nr:hypothetical protein N7456_012599 [Penicillium angulare]